MEKIYNKLVRDKIPEIIVGNGGEPFTRILDEDEYKVELETKLMEEYNEVLLATGEERGEFRICGKFEAKLVAGSDCKTPRTGTEGSFKSGFGCL